MRILPAISTNMPIPMTDLLGYQADNSLLTSLDSINNSCSQTLIQMKDTIKNVFDNGIVKLKKIINFTDNYVEAGIFPITNETLLNSIPYDMLEPIVTFEPVKQLIKDEKIYGFGINYEDIPEEDVWGRLCSNGVVELDEDTDVSKVKLEWKWESTDPEYTFEDIEAISKTRDFISKFIEQEMQNEAPRDFSNFPDLMTNID